MHPSCYTSFVLKLKSKSYVQYGGIVILTTSAFLCFLDDVLFEMNLLGIKQKILTSLYKLQKNTLL